MENKGKEVEDFEKGVLDISVPIRAMLQIRRQRKSTEEDEAREELLIEVYKKNVMVQTVEGGNDKNREISEN